jgi:maltodextrin utilization protein YvdJ
MRKIDFISTAPSLTIFKTGTNQTYLGGSFFLIYLIILLVLLIMYIYDYISQNNYSLEYFLDKNDTSINENEAIKEIQKNGIDLNLSLYKDGTGDDGNLSQNDNFLIVDVNELWEKQKNGKDLDPSDGFTFINSSDTFTDKCIIKSGEIYTAKLPTLGVLYRCDGITAK